MLPDGFAYALRPSLDYSVVMYVAPVPVSPSRHFASVHGEMRSMCGRLCGQWVRVSRMKSEAVNMPVLSSNLINAI